MGKPKQKESSLKYLNGQKQSLWKCNDKTSHLWLHKK